MQRFWTRSGAFITGLHCSPLRAFRATAASKKLYILSGQSNPIRKWQCPGIMLQSHAMLLLCAKSIALKRAINGIFISSVFEVFIVAFIACLKSVLWLSAA